MQDSIVKPIRVLAKPNPAFTAANNTGCAARLNVSFKNASSDGARYLWSFGDGTTSSSPNPVHTYTSYGIFSVSLTVTNVLGCAVTLTKENLVKLTPLKISSISNLGVKGCLPLTVSPVAILENDVAGVIYSWNFGDGTKGFGATPSHTYTTPGVFEVKLEVTTAEGCIDLFVFKEAVKAGNKPKTKISGDLKNECASTPLTFSDLSTGPKTNEWLWYFGDGNISKEQNPVHVYSDTGYFDITLITANFGCYDTLEVRRNVYIKPPVAKFDTLFHCDEPYKRIFVDSSVGATSWNWSFGDGATSTEVKPTHTYSAPGKYPVTLTVTNGECRQTISRDVIVLKEHGSLTASENESCLNTRIMFDVENINENNISSYSWYFDGISGKAEVTDKKPLEWSFATTGDRTATVVLTDILRCNDTIHSPVQIKSYGPKASFGSPAANTCFGNTIHFIDSSQTDGIHPITGYLWDYGENNAQGYTNGPFSHAYSSVGTYDVKLVVTDSYGCRDSIRKPGFVSITEPIAKFTPSDTVACPNLTIKFANVSSGIEVSYKWNFGDGTTSDEVSPVHAFTIAGSYKITLLMVDQNGCTARDSTTIRVYNTKADFAMTETHASCPPLVVKVSNASTNYHSLHWDFGDGTTSQLSDPSHIYTYPGTYTVKLSIRNNGGCTDEITKKVVIDGPTGALDYTAREACNSGKIDYRLVGENTLKYVWDFGDGNTIYSSNSTASHTYLNPGRYLPKVILEDGRGCKVGVNGLDTIKIHSISANIMSDTKKICEGGDVFFTDSTTSDETVSSYHWKFGDGTTSTVKNPKHTFSQGGFYSVELIATTRFGCRDTAFAANYLHVVSPPKIEMAGDTSGCESAEIQLRAEIVGADTSAIRWDWDFGNGAASKMQKPPAQLYYLSGTYRAIVRATNSSGCSDFVSRTVVIHPKPAVDAGKDTIICRSASYTLTPGGADSYTWKAHPTLSCTNCATPVIKTLSAVTYHVAGKSLAGCVNEDSVTISIQQPFKVVTSGSDTLCKGQTVTLKASGADLYQWSPSLWLNNPHSPSPVARPDTSITYQVIGRDINGCFKDTQNVKIKVYPLPSIEITNGENVSVQVGSGIKLNTKSSADVISWKWYPQQWLSCVSCSEPMAAPKDRIKYKVIATNEGVCPAQDEVTVNVICNDANVFMPNTFSPNGDGANDLFYPRGTGLYSIHSFKVFNRWGQLLFQRNGFSANDPQFGWDGTSSGAPLLPDVYIYMIDVVCTNNTILPFNGNITLIR